MNRRGYLGLAAAIGVSGCVDDIQDTVQSVQGTHGPQKEFGAGSPGFDRAGWTDDNLFEVEFGEDHGIDGWGIRYHAHADYEDDIVLGSAPDFAGTETVDLLDAFTEYDGRPPVGEYHIVAYKGDFGQFFKLVEDEIGSSSFYIEPDLTVETAEITPDYEFSATVSNDGNSPCAIETISIQGKQTQVEATVAPGESRDVVSGPDVFPDDDEDPSCMALPDEFTVGFNTLPKQDTDVDMETDYDSNKVCTMSI